MEFQQIQGSYDVTVSWILLALREIVGLSTLRNDIVDAFLNETIKKEVDYGKTFGAESRVTELQDYLESKIKQQKKGKRFFIFSGINRPRYGETHYQGFIIDYRDRMLYVADPAWTRDGPGIYKPFLAQQQVIPFFKTHRFHSQFIATSSPCQTSTQDVFCQTWSLYLMIEFLNHLGQHQRQRYIIPIPPPQIQRYGLLLTFYQEIAERVSEFCVLLKEYYLSRVSRHPSLVKGISCPRERKRIRTFYKNIDPCLVLQNMEPKDMVDEEDDEQQQQQRTR